MAEKVECDFVLNGIDLPPSYLADSAFQLLQEFNDSQGTLVHVSSSIVDVGPVQMVFAGVEAVVCLLPSSCGVLRCIDHVPKPVGACESVHCKDARGAIL